MGRIMRKTLRPGLPGGFGRIGAMTPAERKRGRYMRDGEGHPPQLDMKAWVASVEKKLKDHGVDTGTVNEIKVRVDELEQKMARRGGGGSLFGGEPADTPGKAFAAAEGLSAFAQNQTTGGRLMVETKTITSVSNSAGALAAPAYRDQAVSIPQVKLSVRDLVSVVPITSGEVEIPFQTARASNAGVVAEGALKPESSFAFEMRKFPVRKIAHWTLASMEILQDAPQLAAFIDTELVYGVAYAEDMLILKGDGLGNNFSGMIPNGTTFAAPIVIPAANAIDTIGLALLQNSLADFPADGIVLHPSDWMKVRLLKDAQGKYLLGDPGAAVEPRLFGLPVVETKAMTPADFLVGQFKLAATLYDRMNTMVMASTEDGDNFRRNLVTLLAEERIAFAVKRPKALTYGSFE